MLFGIVAVNAENKTYYFNPGIWDVENVSERYVAWVWEDEGANSRWERFTTDAETGFLKLTLPETVVGMIPVRMNGETTEDDWANSWNKTVDIWLPDVADKSLITVIGWGEGEGAPCPVEIGTLTEPADATYTIVGEYYVGGNPTGFFGKDTWTIYTTNDMVKGSDGIWTKTYNDVELPVGDFKYKVVKNHDWANGSWGFDDKIDDNCNAEYKVTEAGTYDITFYFNPDAKLDNNYHVHCVLTKKGAPVEDAVYTVVGELYYGSDGKELGFFGKSWTILEVNALTKGEDGIYTLTLTDKELPIGTLSYKVVKNDWEQDWGFPDNPNSGNAEYNVTEAGTYDVTFYFNPDALLQNNYHVSCVMTKHTEPAPDPVYTVVGEYYYGEGTRFDFFGEADWTIYEANAMTKGEDGIWTLKMEKELPAGTLNYKVVKGDWEQDWGFPGNGEYGNADYNVLEAGKYDITFYFNPTELLLNNYHVDCNMTVSAGISGITIDKQQTGAVYNLNGQRVAADYKGLVIVNGRKIVIR